MSNRLMVRMTASDNWIIFKTISRENQSCQLYVRRDELFALKYGKQVIVNDGSFAVFERIRRSNTVNIRFYWLRSHCDASLTGWQQDVTLPFEPFMAFLKRCTAEDGPKKMRLLSIETNFTPHLVFYSTRNLRAALSDKLVRRKLCKFLRDNFHWRDATEIQFYDDCIPCSFFFREVRQDQTGICGGLILHGQADLPHAYYYIHT